MAAMLKAIHAQEYREDGNGEGPGSRQEAGIDAAGQSWTARQGDEETLRYIFFLGEHWCSLRTINPLERSTTKICRRTRVVGSFPYGRSTLMLVAARLRHIAGTKWAQRRYMNMDRLRERDKQLREETAMAS